MKPDFMRKLNEARHDAGIPFVLTSAYRTPEWEVSKGRKPDGSHTTGKAVDIACTGSRQRHLIVANLLKAGFHRIGMNKDKNYIHVDADESKDPAVMWLY